MKRRVRSARRRGREDGALVGAAVKTERWAPSASPRDEAPHGLLASVKPIAFTLGFLVFTGVAALGEAAALPPESRVRVTMRSDAATDDSTFVRSGLTPGSRIVGAYLFSDDHVIELRDAKGQSRTIPQEIVAMFEASRGRKSNAGKGAMIGLLAGITSGVVLGIVLADIEDVDDDDKGVWSAKGQEAP